VDAIEFLAGNAVDRVDAGSVVEQRQLLPVHCGVIDDDSFQVGLVSRKALLVLGPIDSLFQELGEDRVCLADGRALQRFGEVEAKPKAAC
jgi:hypothetical protein